MIDQRAIIDPTAQISKNVSIGPYAIIGPNVHIGEGTQIGSHAVIFKNTKLGKNNIIHAFAALGGDPQHTSYKGEETYLEIGDENTIREFCTFNRGTAQGTHITRVGNKNFCMAYTHIAHDCEVGDEIVFSNNASLAGHVKIGNFVVFGAFCGVHQFVTIGDYSFLGRATKVGQDIPPYLLVTGIPGAPRGLNLVGLKRRGFTEETIRMLRRAYSLVYRQSLPLKEALSQLDVMLVECPELGPFIKALKHTQRGVAR